MKKQRIMVVLMSLIMTMLTLYVCGGTARELYPGDSPFTGYVSEFPYDAIKNHGNYAPVVVDPNGGDGVALLTYVACPDSTYGYGEFVLPYCTYQRNGYVFSGWKIYSACSIHGESYTFEGRVPIGCLVGTYSAGETYWVDGMTALVATWMAQQGGITLTTALNASGLSFSNSGSANWFGQAAVSHDGTDAARSGAINDNQSSSMQTTVSGAGTVSFWWKVSSESGYDKLHFYVDGTEVVSAISGSTSWAQISQTLGAGSHTLKWEYSKDSSQSSGDDCGWVDQVVWTPTSTYTVTFNANGGSCSTSSKQYSSGSTLGTLPTATRSGYTFDGWYTSSSGGTKVSSSTTVTGSATYYAHWSVSGSGVALTTALNVSGISFSNGGNASWFGQTAVSHDGSSAARSGQIGASQSSAMQTTVTGPADISFWWKVSSESVSYDYLEFLIDNDQKDKIGGTGGSWAQKTYSIGGGSHTLKWNYRKDGSVDGGDDCGWVDQLVVTPKTTPSDPLAQNGLVAWYKFDGNANDSSGNGNDGTVHGVTLTTDRNGIPNSAYSFDGDDWISVAHDDSLNPDALTVSVWMKPSDWYNGHIPIICKSNVSWQEGSYRSQIDNHGDTITFMLRGSASADNCIEFGKWQLITITVDGQCMCVYRNGSLLAKDDTPDGVQKKSDDIGIGRNIVGATEYFKGSMDDFRIYNRALSAAEVRLLYEEGAETQSDGDLIHRWSFNGNLIDSVGGQTATAVGGVTTESGYYKLAGGSRGTSYINLGADVLPKNGQGATIEIWATQNSIQDWSRIWDVGTNEGTESLGEMYAAWTSESTLNAAPVCIRNVAADKGNLAPYSLGVEYHIAAVFEPQDNGTWKVKFYKQDAKTGTTSASYTISTSSASGWSLSNQAQGSFFLGHSHHATSHDASASYNEVRVWKRALTEAELTANALLGPNVLPGGSVVPGASTYIVTFNANGGSCSTSSKQYSSGATLGTLPTATRSGYTFDGWYSSSSGGTKVSSSTAVTGNVTYYAHWVQNVTYYTVTFNANGGSCLTSSKQYSSGSTLGTLPTATRSGYTFDGWYSSSSGGTKVSSSTKVTGSTTYYAHWTVNSSAKFSVTCWVDGGGTVSGTGKYKKGETVTLTAKAKSGWVFSGYWALPACIGCGPGKTVKMSGNTYSFKMAAMDAPVGATFIRKSDDWIGEFECDDVWYVWRYDGAQDFEFGEVESESKPSYSASGLPNGIVKSGLYLKCAKPTSVKPGVYTVTLTAKNRSGHKTTKKIKIYVGNKEAEEVFPELNTDFDGYECQVGVPLDADVFSVYPTSGWKTSASGLPSGVKWNASKGCFTGVPTKKGTYVVTLKGVKGKTTKTATAFFFVRALPSSVVGTFNGYATDGEYGFDSRSKIVKVTVSSSGKISAKIGSTTYSRTGFSSRNGSVYSATLSKKEKITSGCGKGGYKVWTVNIRIDADADWRTNQLQGDYSYVPGPCMVGSYYELQAQRNPFGKDSNGKYVNEEAASIAKKYAALGKVGLVVNSSDGIYDIICKNCVYCGPSGCKTTLFAKVSTSGTVSLSGKIGGKTVSGSAPLILDWGDRYENEARTRFVVKSSDGKKTFVIQLGYLTYWDYGAYEPNGYAVQSGRLNDCGEAIPLDNPYDSDCDEEYWD